MLRRKREAIQEILRRENELALAPDQMGNSEAERSLHDAWSPDLTGEGRQPWRRSKGLWRVKKSFRSLGDSQGERQEAWIYK